MSLGFHELMNKALNELKDISLKFQHCNCRVLFFPPFPHHWVTGTGRLLLNVNDLLILFHLSFSKRSKYFFTFELKPSIFFHAPIFLPESLALFGFNVQL